MKINLSLTAALLSLGITFCIHSAQAQSGNQPVSQGDNDLIMGFRAAAAPGNTINLELNLGEAASYYNPTGAPTFATIAPVVVANIGRLSLTDLNNTYGSGWATRTNLFWGIAGTANTSGSFDGIFAQNTIYLSRPETTAGTQTNPWTRQPNNNQANSQVSSLGGTGGYTGNSTATSDYDVLVTASNANSYQSQSASSAGQTFGIVNGSFQNDTVTGAFSSGMWVSVVDLFALEPGSGPGVYLGSFGLAADGRMDYSPNASYFAVPEPGAISYLLCACVMAAIGRRRHRTCPNRFTHFAASAAA